MRAIIGEMIEMKDKKYKLGKVVGCAIISLGLMMFISPPLAILQSHSSNILEELMVEDTNLIVGLIPGLVMLCGFSLFFAKGIVQLIQISRESEGWDRED